MRPVTLNFTDWLEAIFWHSRWHTFWHSFWHSVWHSFWHIFWHSFSRLRSGRKHWAHMVAVEVRQGTLGTAGRSWGPAGNTGRRGSRLRPGKEHWAQQVPVEVRQGTLAADGRGLCSTGPAGNTGHGGSRLRADSTTTLRADSTMTTRKERRREGVKESTDIKSNNPHLTGGEIDTHTNVSMLSHEMVMPFLFRKGTHIFFWRFHFYIFLSIFLWNFWRFRNHIKYECV